MADKEKILIRVMRNGEVLHNGDWWAELWKIEKERNSAVLQRQREKEKREYEQALEMNEAWSRIKNKIRRTIPAPEPKKQSYYELYGDSVYSLCQKGFSHAQIGRILDISPQTVYLILVRKRKEEEGKK